MLLWLLLLTVFYTLSIAMVTNFVSNIRVSKLLIVYKFISNHETPTYIQRFPNIFGDWAMCNPLGDRNSFKLRPTHRLFCLRLTSQDKSCSNHSFVLESTSMSFQFSRGRLIYQRVTRVVHMYKFTLTYARLTVDRTKYDLNVKIFRSYFEYFHITNRYFENS